MTIEKYGVVIDPDKTKTAEKQGETTIPDSNRGCPECGAAILILPQGMGGHAIHCPNCGTKPFEKEKDS